MQIPMTMKQVMAEVPAAYAEIKKKASAAMLKKLKWEMSVAERIFGGHSLLDVLHGKMPDPPPKRTVEERVADVKDRLGVSLRAWSKGHVFYAQVSPIPERVLKHYRARYENEEAEAKRVASLTPAQRDAETQEILKQLVGTPGFMMIQVPVHKPRS